MTPRVRITHPHAPPFTREALKALREGNKLVDFITTIAFREGYNFPFPNAINRQLSKRTWIPKEVNVKHRPSRELLRLILQKSHLDRFLGISTQSLVDWVYKDFDNFVSQQDYSSINAVYCYEDAAALTFKEAKKRDAQCIYDLPIMYHKEARAIEAAEADKFPELTPAFYTLHEPSWKIDRKEQELELADKIVVASELTKNSLVKHGFGKKNIFIVPYGTNPVQTSQTHKQTDYFNVLFVGRVGPRKGVHYLLDSWNKLALPNSKLTLVGINEFPNGQLEKRLGKARYLPSMPRDELSNLYQQADLLVLPSLVEGFGLVLLEALAHGVPFIASNNTAGPEIIKNFDCGWCIEPSNPELLSDKLLYAFNTREELREKSIAAKAASQYYSWEKYRVDLLKAISSE